MATYEFFVSLPVTEAADRIVDQIVNNTASGELVDQHSLNQPNGNCRILVFERYYWRASNRVTLTVTVDDFTGRTRVHTVGSGGGEAAFFRFDWGASSSFAGLPQKALADFIC